MTKGYAAIFSVDLIVLREWNGFGIWGEIFDRVEQDEGGENGETETRAREMLSDEASGRGHDREDLGYGWNEDRFLSDNQQMRLEIMEC
jgi:hypothetical protein